ncbi:MAG: adenylosuccinate synthetase [Pseudomonadota bacterium]
MRPVVIISGHTSVGKSVLAKNLKGNFEFSIFKSSDYLKEIARKRSLETDRRSLMRLGDQLDSETGCRWLLTAVEKFAATKNSGVPVVVDSVRNACQLKRFRQQTELEVTHVHLYTTRRVLYRRLAKRREDQASLLEFSNPQRIDFVESEEDIDSFKKDADIRIFTERTDADDTLTRVAAYLGLYPAPDLKCVDVLIGGQYGSEGKGQIAAYLSQEYDLLMRVGGPNAGHKAARELGKYTYHSLPSGCRESSGDVLIGPGATIHIEEFLKEVEECGLDSDRVFLAENVMVITEEDREEEERLVRAIGSTGRGGGSAAARRIMQRFDCPDGARLASSYKELEPYVKSTHKRLQQAYARGEKILLEGTQGSLLSLYHGPYPHVTSRDTNVAGCLAEAGIPPRRVNRVLMVVRFTPIRVQSPEKSTSGKLKHETTFEKVADQAGITEDLTAYEKTSTTNLDRRVGWFEWDSFRIACELNSPTDIVLTFADYHHADNRKARRFELMNADTIKFIEELERVAQAPVSLVNTRFPHDEDDPLDLRTAIDRRRWRTRVRRTDD